MSTPSPPRTRLYIAGSVNGSSIAPPVHNFIAGKIRPEWNMKFLHADTIQSVVTAFQNPDFAGGSVTMPWKTSIMPYLDEIDELALLMGACNTVYVTADGKLRGTNTDWFGITTAIKAATPPPPPPRNSESSCGMIYGAGGASKAALYTLAVQLGLKTIYVVNRDDDEVSCLLSDAGRYANKVSDFRLVPVKTLQQARSLLAPTYVVGTVPDIQPHTPREMEAWSILSEFLHRGNHGVLVDMCYHPKITRLLQLGVELGWTTVDGVQVLAHLFRIQWKLWTGEELEGNTEEQAIALLDTVAEADRTVTPRGGVRL
ncbi:hypothetical protein FE257_012422 [Aspergillus nanangensis]|uniref:Shikimate dehydrogenase substrate binding N-terminal domain-containing protein n=1 Tax=Aspergillus nanangensis TaxID=2582783 RepID=A0AAD4CUL6_ASPNN|nr:hypothetical protein FE257_012422 [Aspergillus nanangensis]